MNTTTLHKLQPYEGIIRFVVAMLAANYFWKFTVIGDEHGYGAVTWFGLDLTWYFDRMTDHIAGILYTMLGWLDDSAIHVNGCGRIHRVGLHGYQAVVHLADHHPCRARQLADEVVVHTCRLAVCVRV